MKHERISIDPEVMVGKPCIKGTRITVEHILRLLARGMSEDEIVRGHARLALEDVRAAEAYAADVLSLPNVRSQLTDHDAATGR